MSASETIFRRGATAPEGDETLEQLSLRIARRVLVLGAGEALFFWWWQGSQAAFVLTLAVAAVIVQWRGLTARVRLLVPAAPAATGLRDPREPDQQEPSQQETQQETQSSAVPTGGSRAGGASSARQISAGRILQNPLPRYLVLAAIFFLLFRIGRDQPQALVAGVTLLPVALILEALRAAVLGLRSR